MLKNKQLQLKTHVDSHKIHSQNIYNLIVPSFRRQRNHSLSYNQMLTFTTLLFIAISIVDLDGASPQSPKEYTEFEANLQSSSISSFPGPIRRSADQRHDDYPQRSGPKEGCIAPEDGETVNEILQHSLVELTDTLQTLESNDPFKTMRVPLHVIPMQSPESLMIFQSLLKMLSNPTESHSSTPWQQYLEESIRKRQCSVMDLCREFHHNFKCEKGQLKSILLDNAGKFDHLNLLMIPNTVTNLCVRRAKLRTISGWTDLKEKSLKVLLLNENKDLELNLDGLRGEFSYLSLEHLSVSGRAMTNSFREKNWERALTKIGDWMKTSTLTSLRLRARRSRTPGRNVCFSSDGSWKIE